MISLPILIKSDPKNEVIPLNVILSSVLATLSARTVVWEVETIGDWIKLSNATKHLAFLLVATNLWDVPIPTLLSSIATGNLFSAFSAEVASLILLSDTLMTNISSPEGKNSVLPAPAKVVAPIPIAEVIPPFLWYLTASPLT